MRSLPVLVMSIRILIAIIQFTIVDIMIFSIVIYYVDRDSYQSSLRYTKAICYCVVILLEYISRSAPSDVGEVFLSRDMQEYSPSFSLVFVYFPHGRPLLDTGVHSWFDFFFPPTLPVVLGCYDLIYFQFFSAGCYYPYRKHTQGACIPTIKSLQFGYTMNHCTM